MYTARVKESVSSIRELAKDMGYMESYKIDGMIRGALSMPGLFSGTLSTDYTAKADGWDSENSLTNLVADYTMFMGSGKLTAKQIDIITKWGDFFMNYTDLDVLSLMTPEMATVVKKYEKKWLSMTQSEMMGEEGAIEENQIAQKLSSLSLGDIEDYLVRYPLWKETQDLGMEGSLHSYEVTLHKENLIALMKDFTKKATGKDMPEADVKSMQDDLAKIEAKGKMSLDPKNPKIAKWNGTVSELSGSGMTVRVVAEESEKWISLDISGDVGSMNLVYEKGTDMNSMKILAKEGTEEFAKLDAKFSKKWGKLTRIDATFEAPSQGLTITLEHVNNEDRSFEGKLNAWIGNIIWKGKLETTGLTELKITGAMAGSSLLLDLKNTGDSTLKGPLSLKSGNTPIVDANVALKLNKEQFMLAVDIANPEDPEYTTHAEIDITGKRSPWSGDITIPSPVTPLKTLTDEISALTPNTENAPYEDTGVLTPPRN